MANTEKVCTFTAAVRGFHYYRRLWRPTDSQKLFCLFEIGNSFDRFAIKTVTEEDQIVGHLPREISRVTKFLLDRGAKIYLTLCSTNYRRSPLVQGGLEIACKIVVKMPGTVKNHMIVDRYKNLVEERYTEPQNETMMGSFLVQLEPMALNMRKPASNKNKKKNSSTVVASKDIRGFFANAKVTKNNNDVETSMVENNKKVIVLD